MPPKHEAAPARRLALDALTEVRRREAYANLFLDAAFARRAVSEADRRLATALVSGVLRRRRELDARIDRVSKIPVREMEPAVADALRLAVFQLAHMDRVPARAAISESVKLAPRRATGFVKAVLERLARELPATYADDFAVRYSLPDELAQDWTERFGPAQAEAMAAALLAEPVAALRACGVSREEALEGLHAEGVEAAPSTVAPKGIVVRRLEAALRSSLFERGRLTVQGEGSQLVGHLCAAKTGMRVLDLCAAPGGKTTDLAERVGPTGHVVAVDIHEGRADRVRENAQRLGLGNVEVVVADALAWGGDAGTFDLVLLDAPCTAWGQIGRHPEIKWRIKPDDPERLAALQATLWERALAHVAPGGRAVFSVCTFSQSEMSVPHLVVRRLSGFEHVDARTELPENGGGLSVNGDFLMLPGEIGHEGFFASVFQRQA